jgi:AcrR family transcriptional regulator
LRDITTEAQTNLAAVNYHFGSKEKLIQAVLARRIDPLNRERLRLLDAYQAERGNAPVSLEKILDAFITPSIHLCLQNPHSMRLAGRMIVEPDKSLRRILLAQFEEVVRRFRLVLMDALPDLPEPELVWRMHFMVGAMIHTWISASDLEFFSEGAFTRTSEQEVVKRLMAFCAAGLRAPVQTPRRASHPTSRSTRKPSDRGKEKLR